VKKLVYILFFLCSFANVFSQHDVPPSKDEIIVPDSLDSKTGIYNVVDEMPEFPGGTKEMYMYIKTNLKYPVDAKEQGKEGKMYIKFVVDIYGKVKDPIILRSVGFPSLDMEALRIVNNMPLWKAGKQRGKEVPVYYILPINFKL